MFSQHQVYEKKLHHYLQIEQNKKLIKNSVFRTTVKIAKEIFENL